MYSKKVLEHFNNPRFAGEMKDADGVGEFGNPRCGDLMKIFIKVRDDVIIDVRFLTYGCIGAIASSDMMCELVKGKTIDEAMKMSHKEIIDSLGEMPPIKYHCSVLGVSALRKAIEDYKKKKDKKSF